jgi:hypothetical protein
VMGACVAAKADNADANGCFIHRERVVEGTARGSGVALRRGCWRRGLGRDDQAGG